jgi:hypothetical protein
MLRRRFLDVGGPEEESKDDREQDADEADAGP